MNCPQCGAENPDSAKFCSKCGATLAVPAPEPVTPPPPPPVTECPACKAPRKDDAKFCGACGHRFEEAAALAEASTVPGAAGNPLPESPKESAAVPVPADAPKGNNTMIVIIIVVLLAIIAAAGGGWYMWNKGKSAPSPQTTATQPGVEGQQPGQPGMPQVDANGMPIKQPGAEGGQPGQPTQPGMPQVDANGMPISQPGQTPVQPGAAAQPAQQQPVAAGQRQVAQPSQDVMPEPMPQEARKRRAQSEAGVQPQRKVRAGGSIDQQYEQRAAAECPSGGGGFFCREKIRYQLCNGRWSENPPPGQVMCRKAN